MNDLHRQKGLTLLSLLVGITLSLFSMLACISLFTQHHLSSRDSKASSIYNSQMIHSLTIMNKEVSSAGFGLENTTTPHFLIENDTAGETNVFWRYQDGASVVCRGISERQSVVGGDAFTTLVIRDAFIGCGNTPAFNTMTWVDRGILVRWENDDLIDDFLTDASNVTGTLVNFSLSPANITCTPYNAVDPDNAQPRPNLTISAPTLAELNGNTDVARSRVDVCLTNIN